MVNKKIEVMGSAISIYQTKENDYISLTDIARYKSNSPDILIQNWLRNRNTIEFLGLWEKLSNPSFKPLEFEGFKSQAGLNAFLMSPKKWIIGVNAIGMISRSGKYGGGTFAHKDIALEFANWVSVEFRLYLIKEFQRLKEIEMKSPDWNVKRFLTKMNYKIHTDAIKNNLIPQFLSKDQISYMYADEADVLNISLFGQTAKQWRDKNPNQEGNIRDIATIEQLIVLANLESLNAEYIKLGVLQEQRLQLLNQTAITQMKSLLEYDSGKRLLEEI